MVRTAVISSTTAGVVGVAALAYAAVASPDAGDGRIWIDGPLAGSSLEPGVVRVAAHASADERIDDLVLEVDGRRAGDDPRTERNDSLVFAVFDWEAEAGQHVLVVRRASGDARSAARVVLVGDGTAAAPTPSASPTPRPSPSDAPSSSAPPSTPPSPSASASATPSASPATPTPRRTREPQPTPRPTPRPTQRPTPHPTPTPTPDPPVIDAAAFVGDPRVYQGSSCPSYQVVVQARIRGATSASVVVAGRTIAMSASGSTFSGTIGSGWPPDAVGERPVTVRADGPGGVATRTVGTVSIRPSCPKD